MHLLRIVHIRHIDHIRAIGVEAEAAIIVLMCPISHMYHLQQEDITVIHQAALRPPILHVGTVTVLRHRL